MATVDLKGGRVVVTEGAQKEALEREAWVFAGRRAVARPLAAPDVERAAFALAGVRTGVDRDVAGRVRLRAAPGAANRARIATVVAAVSLAPYEQSERTSRLGTVILGVFVVLAGALISRQVVGAGLRPVARMAQQAATYGEQDLARRFDLGRPRDGSRRSPLPRGPA